MSTYDRLVPLFHNRLTIIGDIVYFDNRVRKTTKDGLIRIPFTVSDVVYIMKTNLIYLWHNPQWRPTYRQYVAFKDREGDYSIDNLHILDRKVCKDTPVNVGFTIDIAVQVRDLYRNRDTNKCTFTTLCNQFGLSRNQICKILYTPPVNDFWKKVAEKSEPLVKGEWRKNFNYTFLTRKRAAPKERKVREPKPKVVVSKPAKPKVKTPPKSEKPKAKQSMYDIFMSVAKSELQA